jgi:thermitase
MDNTRVAHVDVFMNDSLVGTATYGTTRADIAATFPNASPTTGFGFLLDTSRFLNGAYQLGVRATDDAGNVSTFATAAVAIDNVVPAPAAADTTAPTVSITSVSSRRSTLTVSVVASDNIGVSTVDLLIDGQLVATDLTVPYTFKDSSKGYSSGKHQITAVATDAAGNAGTSLPAVWTVR